MVVRPEVVGSVVVPALVGSAVDDVRDEVVVTGDVTVVGMVDMTLSASVRAPRRSSMIFTSSWICVMRSVVESVRFPARTTDSREAPVTVVQETEQSQMAAFGGDQEQGCNFFKKK